MVIAEQFYQKLQPLFKQLNEPAIESNPHGYYALPLEGPRGLSGTHGKHVLNYDGNVADAGKPK